MYIKGAGAAALAMAAFAVVPQANAATIVSGSFGTGTGVHSTGAQTGTTVDAFVNQDNSAVTFSSSSSLSIPGSGEATVTGPMTDLDVLFAKGWNNITFGLTNVKKTDLSNFTLSVTDSLGTTLFNAGNCSICQITGSNINKFIVSGSGITDLSFTFNPAIDSGKQFRVEGLTNGGIPEPATWALMIIGFGAIGGSLRVRNRKLRYAS